MRSLVTDEAPMPKILPDGTVVLVFRDGSHPEVHVDHKVVRRFCSDVMFLIDEWERKQPVRKRGNVCRFERKPPRH